MALTNQHCSKANLKHAAEKPARESAVHIPKAKAGFEIEAAARGTGKSVVFDLIQEAIVSQKEMLEFAKLNNEQLVALIDIKMCNMPKAEVTVSLKKLSCVVGRMADVMQSQNSNASARSDVLGPHAILTAAKRQAEAAREELILSRLLVSSGDITNELSISRQALSKAVQANRMFTLEFKNERYYPAFFADITLERRNLEQVCKALRNISSWEKWLFFTTPKGSLGGITPLEALRNGKQSNVLKAAQGFAER